MWYCPFFTAKKKQRGRWKDENKLFWQAIIASSIETIKCKRLMKVKKEKKKGEKRSLILYNQK